MAIGPDQRTTTTGLIDKKPMIPAAADLSAMNQQPAQDPTTMIPQTGSSEQSKMTTTLGGTKNLTDEEIDSLDAAMSPSVKEALSKIFPDLAPVIGQLGSDEPNVIFPLSIVKRFAMQRYGGQDENEAVQNFMTDVISPDIELAQMENQNNVPPGAEQPTNETAGLMTSPQNMETV